MLQGEALTQNQRKEEEKKNKEKKQQINNIWTIRTTREKKIHFLSVLLRFHNASFDY